MSETILFMVKSVERAEWVALREHHREDFAALETVRRALKLLWEIERPDGPWQQYAKPIARNETSERAFDCVGRDGWND